ncbi:nucleotidyltransferase family protein [Muricauda sp. SCSIO 64092]|nr:nucleotidyltransferase family protein [Muricauda sp. SCSIO 64092]
MKKRYPISSMALFGSYARNEQTEISDIDIMVEFDGRIGSRFIDLANELENALGVKVDLVSKKGIKDHYLKAIQSEFIYV